jgi:hypothetical protein
MDDVLDGFIVYAQFVKMLTDDNIKSSKVILNTSTISDCIRYNKLGGALVYNATDVEAWRPCVSRYIILTQHVQKKSKYYLLMVTTRYLHKTQCINIL